MGEAAYFIVNFDEESNVYFNDKFYIFDNDVDRNILFHTGSNIFPGSSIPSMEIPGPTFYVEFQGPSSTAFAPTTLEMNTYGVKMYVIPVISDPAPSSVTIFHKNSAGNRGGAMLLTFANSFPIITAVKFDTNKATFGGGAIYMTNANKGVVYHRVDFTFNEAGGDGGAIYLSMSHFGHQFKDCSFNSNSAVGEGGGLLMSTANGDGTFDSGNAVLFENCDFRRNTAANGGALSATISNIVTFLDCNFVENVAISGSGGAVIAHQYNEIILQNSWVHKNKGVTFGGDIDVVLYNTVRFVDVNITDNFVNNSGGGLTIRGLSTVNFDGNCVFEANHALAVGGAIAVMSSELWSIEGHSTLVLRANVASRGSALFFSGLHSTDPSDELHNMVMTRNVATIGGTVFWLYDDSMSQEPPGLNSSTVHFDSNDAVYGNRIATQALVLITPAEYSVESYGVALDPPISLHMVDFYNQVVLIDGYTSVSVSVLDPQEDRCSGFRPYVAGQDTVGSGLPFVQGVVDFSNLLVQCYPNGSLILRFEAKLGNLANVPQQIAAPYYIRNFTKLHFRSCQVGEIYVNGMCIPCPRGTYSLVDKITERTECEPCTSEDGVESCWANQIVVTEVITS